MLLWTSLNNLNYRTMYGYMIEVETNKVNDLSDNIENGLYYIGRAMSIAKDLCQSGEMGERNGNRYGNRYGDRFDYPKMGMREMPEYDDYGNPMGMRRMRDTRGRFM